jgi:hypothetical protein
MNSFLSPSLIASVAVSSFRSSHIFPLSLRLSATVTMYQTYHSREVHLRDRIVFLYSLLLRSSTCILACSMIFAWFGPLYLLFFSLFLFSSFSLRNCGRRKSFMNTINHNEKEHLATDTNNTFPLLAQDLSSQASKSGENEPDSGRHQCEDRQHSMSFQDEWAYSHPSTSSSTIPSNQPEPHKEKAHCFPDEIALVMTPIMLGGQRQQKATRTRWKETKESKV